MDSSSTSHQTQQIVDGSTEGGALNVKCEFCGTTCILKTTTPPADWVVFPWYECPEHCPFFIRADLVRPCVCGAGHCLIRMSYVGPSKGRQFWCCPQSAGNNHTGCGMFEWLEDENVKMRKATFLDIEHMSVVLSSTKNSTSPQTGEGYIDGATTASENLTKSMEDLEDSFVMVELGN